MSRYSTLKLYSNFAISDLGLLYSTYLKLKLYIQFGDLLKKP